MAKWSEEGWKTSWWKRYITERNRRSSWEWQGIIGFCNADGMNEWMNVKKNSKKIYCTLVHCLCNVIRKCHLYAVRIYSFYSGRWLHIPHAQAFMDMSCAYTLTNRSILSNSDVAHIAHEVRIVVILIQHLNEDIGQTRTWWHSWISSSYSEVQKGKLFMVNLVGYYYLARLRI